MKEKGKKNLELANLNFINKASTLLTLCPIFRQPNIIVGTNLPWVRLAGYPSLSLSLSLPYYISIFG